MEPQGSRQRALMHASATLSAACGAILLAISAQVLAQQAVKPADKDGTDAAGAVIVPPAIDPGMSKQAPPMPDAPAVKPPPADIDHGAVREPPPKAGASEAAGKTKEQPAKRKPRHRPGAQANVPRTGTSAAEDRCKGSSESCKQDFAR